MAVSSCGPLLRQGCGGGLPDGMFLVPQQLVENRDRCRACLAQGLRGSLSDFPFFVREQLGQRRRGCRADLAQGVGRGLPHGPLLFSQQFAQGRNGCRPDFAQGFHCGRAGLSFPCPSQFGKGRDGSFCRRSQLSQCRGGNLGHAVVRIAEQFGEGRHGRRPDLSQGLGGLGPRRNPRLRQRRPVGEGFPLIVCPDSRHFRTGLPRDFRSGFPPAPKNQDKKSNGQRHAKRFHGSLLFAPLPAGIRANNCSTSQIRYACRAGSSTIFLMASRAKAKAFPLRTRMRRRAAANRSQNLAGFKACEDDLLDIAMPQDQETYRRLDAGPLGGVG